MTCIPDYVEMKAASNRTTKLINTKLFEGLIHEEINTSSTLNDKNTLTLNSFFRK